MRLLQGDNLPLLKLIEDNSVDAVVTDPPYGLSFMGKKWDYDVPSKELWEEVLRVLKPGGHLLSFSGTRTYHRMAVNIEDAGFEVRDMIEWVYASGFPKSLNIGKAVDKLQRGNKTVELINALLEEGKTLKELGEMAGIPSLESSYRDWTTGGHKPEERSWDRMLKGLGFSEADGLNIIEKRTVSLGGGNAYTFREGEKRDWEMKITKGTSEWEGWGTSLKPSHEPICMARKPLAEKTVAENVLKYGTGGINIDESRVGTTEDLSINGNRNNVKSHWGNSEGGSNVESSPLGRFPANLILEDCEEVRECFPETNASKKRLLKDNESDSNGTVFSKSGYLRAEGGVDDSGGNASRFFKSIIYQAKASKSERNRGCEELEEKVKVFNGQSDKPSEDMKDVEKRFTTLPKANNHPTVKPVALMEYLIEMVTPKGGTVLDPYMGSGTTGIACKQKGFDFIGIEMDAEYCKIAEARIHNTPAQQTLI